jgi:RNA polymerase sigma factor (sigma-70 family)
MHEFTDQKLLRRYAEHGADDAFAELVRRHCDLVWAAARRVSGDGEIARDVAQTVFTDLARKAGKLPAKTVLAGWLYRAACHATANHIRGEARRAQREQQAMHQHELQATGAAERRAAEELQPVLDAALGDLAEADRDAVMLRYLAGRSLAEIGVTLGTSEDAAQKRVSRALEKLREAFRQRGVDLTGGTVVAAMTLAGAQAAPAGLAASLAGTTLAGAVTGTSPTLLFMKSKLALGIVGGAVMTTALVWQQRNISRLAGENVELLRQMSVLTNSMTDSLEAARRASAKEFDQLKGEHADLLRLRNELSQLRRQNAASLANQSAQNPTETYSTVSAATPNAGLDRLVAASRLGDAVNVAKCVTWRIGEDVPKEMADQMQGPLIRNLTNTIMSNGDIRILNRLNESDTLMRARVEFLDQNGKANLRELRFALEEGGWKPVINIEREPSGSISAAFVLPPTPELGPTKQ